MDFKKTNAENTTITRDVNKLDQKTGNVYEAIAVVCRRANQVSVEMKEELQNKLQEFASHTDNLEEIFENREQIEISKIYEKLPKPTSIALQEYLDDKIYFRNPSKESNQ
ncbi:MAG: DNA-directed RNA polymerase subunit omega [Bacteroidota bacterium]|jgi:DNA-directed RNA polymerase subunit K/omega